VRPHLNQTAVIPACGRLWVRGSWPETHPRQKYKTLPKKITKAKKGPGSSGRMPA
jgi:hypothetical protein